MSPVHGTDARSILEVEAFHEPRSSEREFAHFWKEIRADSRRLLPGVVHGPNAFQKRNGGSP